ncbi:hypothetical protein BDW62DRAFT_76886 [Aspergillus aurantiobrunneus]
MARSPSPSPSSQSLFKRALGRLCFCFRNKAPDGNDAADENKIPGDDESSPHFGHLANTQPGEMAQPTMAEIEKIFKLRSNWGPFFPIKDEDLVPIPDKLETKLRKAGNRFDQQIEMVAYCLKHEITSLRARRRGTTGSIGLSFCSALELVAKYDGKPRALNSVVEVSGWYEDSEVAAGLVVNSVDHELGEKDQEDPKLECILHMASMLRLKNSKSAVVYGVVDLEDNEIVLLKLDMSGRLAHWRPTCAYPHQAWSEENKIKTYALVRLLVQHALKSPNRDRLETPVKEDASLGRVHGVWNCY